MEADTAVVVRNASSVSSPVVSATVTPVMVPFPERGVMRRIIPPSMGRSTRYAVFQPSFSRSDRGVWLFHLDAFLMQGAPFRVSDLEAVSGLSKPTHMVGAFSSSSGEPVVTIAQRLPLVILCSSGVECSAATKDRSDARATLGMAKKEALDVGEFGAFTTLEEGVNSSFAIDPPLEKASTGDLDRTTLALHGGEVRSSVDSFIWPHPMDPRKAIFVVDDTAEQAMWAGASRSHKGVWVTLLKMDDAIAAVAKLNVEAQRSMANEVMDRGQVSFLCLVPSLSSLCELCFQLECLAIFLLLQRLMWTLMEKSSFCVWPFGCR